MPLDPISWIIIGFVAGALTATFWDEITEWASRALEAILRAIDLAVTVTSNGIVSLVKQSGRIYKKVEVVTRNIHDKVTKKHTKTEEISPYDVPDELEEELERKSKIKLLEQKT